MTGPRATRSASAVPDDADPTAGSGGHDTGVDHDQAAQAARGRRLIVDLDRVRVLADAHSGEHPDWHEVAAVIDCLRATLSREFCRLPTATTHR